MAKLNRADLDGVIRRYAPLICLHPREKYFPCSVEWFLERAKLRRKSGGDGGPVSVSTLPSQNVGEGEYWLDYPNTDEAKSGQMDTARAYVHARLGYDESYTDQGNGFEGHSTLSAPVVQGDWVYFQGTNNGLFRTRTDGSVWHQIGGHETTAAPFVVNEKVYFRGTNKKLLMVSTGDRQEAAAGAGAGR